MTWTYTPANIGSSGLSFIRFKIGDTTSGRMLLQDEEILGQLGEVGDQYWAAAYCARAIAGNYATRVDKSVGRLRIATNQAAKAYLDLAARLEAEAACRTALPYAGGISISDKEAQVADADRVLPQFALGMDDLPGVGISSTSENVY